jgi:hypothetical protein
MLVFTTCAMIYMLCMRQCEIIQPPLIVEAKVYLSGIDPVVRLLQFLMAESLVNRK